MGFSNFKTEIEVAKRFNLKTDSKPFVKTLPLRDIISIERKPAKPASPVGTIYKV